MSEFDLPLFEDQRPYWGNPSTPSSLSEGTLNALKLLGVEGGPHPAKPLAEVELSPSTLTQPASREIEAIVGPNNLLIDPASRAQHTRGWSLTDILKMRSGDCGDAPDAVVLPGSHDEVAELLKVCSEHRIAVTPFSGGTSVVGGLVAERSEFTAVVSLDLRRLTDFAIDEVSHIANLGAGLRGLTAEKMLREAGFTLGHFPQSYESASIGGYAAARSSGQASAGYGRFDEMVVGLTVATPSGTVEIDQSPRSATGPDLRQLFLGSEGALGVITSVRVQLHRAPEARVFEGWRFPDFATGAAALRKLAQAGPMPTVVRLSDEAETFINLADPGADASEQGGCLAITGYEGATDEVALRRAAATQALTDAGGSCLGEAPGEAWRAGRFRGPYLRDPLLEVGALVETLETATFWSKIDQVKADVAQALTEALQGQGTMPLVMCHISHIYRTGACLYFTVVCAQSPDPIAQWKFAKQAANAAIVKAGAAVSHHHGVGTDHRDALAAELGPLAIETIRAAKRTVDPAGILNPGVMIARA